MHNTQDNSTTKMTIRQLTIITGLLLAGFSTFGQNDQARQYFGKGYYMINQNNYPAGKQLNDMRILTIILLFGLLSCSQTKDENLYVGDLRFNSLFRFGSFYNESDSVIKRINSIIDTVDTNDNVP